jgi:conjugal transfer pilus assembly protein TraU
MKLRQLVLYFYLALSLLPFNIWSEKGHFINPITDICWSCIFPIHVAGLNVTPGYKDLHGYKAKPLCSCAGLPPKVGLPLAFWEPTGLVDVTRTPYKLTAWGGITLAQSDVRKKGSVSHVGDSGRTSFYNVHYYNFPVLAWLNILTDFSCLEKSEMSVNYLSELDPFWDDDEWSAVLNPEMFLFSNPLAQAACIADCTASTINKPLDPLFWCAGCAGSLYPLSGYVAHHVGAVQSSHLVLQRLISKFHSIGLGLGFEEGDYCEKSILPRLKKTIYKTQLVHPIAQTKGSCPPLGKSEVVWGANKSYPYDGEDFVYLIWHKKHCCLDAVKPILKAATGGIVK